MKMDAFFRHYAKHMREHCQAGMRVPRDVSPEAVFDKKRRLLLTVIEFNGPEEFEGQKKVFARHVNEFANTYGFPTPTVRRKAAAV